MRPCAVTARTCATLAHHGAQATGVTIALSGQAAQTYGYVKDTTGADNDPAQPGQTYQQTTPYPTSGPGAGSVVASVLISG